MHKMLVNQAELSLTISPFGPVLIKAGEGASAANPSLPDMSFVRSRGEVYFPGSSLKGVIRSHCERIVRSVAGTLKDCAVGGSCNPVMERESCVNTKGLKKTTPSNVMYQSSCFICQLFGHTQMASHVQFADAYLTADSKAVLEERNGVAIDRIFGSVAQGPFQFETLVDGDFETRITLQNFTCAHLGLLVMALHDLKDHVVRVGFGKSRGLGHVDVKFGEVSLRLQRGGGAEGVFTGLMSDEHIRDSYGSDLLNNLDDRVSGLGAATPDLFRRAQWLIAADDEQRRGQVFAAFAGAWAALAERLEEAAHGN